MRPARSVLCLALLAACNTDASSEPESLTLQKQAGDGQSAQAGAAVPTPPSVRLTSSSGDGVAGVRIDFAVASGGGTVSGASPVTNAQGVATVGGWTLGAQAGAQTLTATADDDRVTGGGVTFTATAGAGPASQVTKQAGDNQAGIVGLAVTVLPAVLVADAGGNPVDGVQVEFAVASGGGTATGTTVETGANGVATVGSWVLGTQAGPNTLTATVAGTGLAGNPATFTVNAAAGPAAALAVSAGDNQTGVVGQPVAVPPAVLATDAYGNAVVNLEVDFAVASGGGAITDAIQYTGATGTAAVGSWTLGPASGVNTLTATAIGAGIAGNPITFTATAAAALNAAPYAGNWSGTWTNTTFASTGTTTLVIAVDVNASTVTLTSSSTGNVLGQGGGAPQQSRMVAYDATGLTLMATLQLYGDVVMTVDGSGNVVAAGTNVPAAGIDRWDATGTITPTTMQFNFTIAFTGGGTAAGTVTLNKQ